MMRCVCAQGSALGPDDCGNASDERKPQRVAWDSDTEVANPLAQPPLRVVDVQVHRSGADRAQDLSSCSVASA